MKYRIIAAFWILTLSCNKSIHLISEQKAVSDMPLYCIREMKPGSDTLVACGGSRYHRGDVFFSYDNGSTWWAQKALAEKALYDIRFINDSIVCAVGYDGKLLMSYDKGFSWNLTQLDYIPLKRLLFFNNTLFIVGGVGLRTGIIYQCNLNGDVLQRDTFQNELSDIVVAYDGTLKACGYGLILSSADGGQHWITEDAEGDFFQCFVQTAEGLHVMGMSGTILKPDKDKWISVSKGNSIFRSGIHLIHSAYQPTTERWVVCGKRNALFEVREGGRFRHQPIHLNEDKAYNFNYVLARDQSFLLATDEGVIIKLPVY